MTRISTTSLRTLAGAASLLTATVRGGESVVLFDAGGFADESLYPLGELRSVAHGDGRWTPASGTAQPGQIVALNGDRFPRAFRRYQTGRQEIDADVLDFPPAAATQLTISFDARVSTADSRTLTLYLLRPGETEAEHQASVLIWGHHPGKLTWFRGAHREITQIDTDWHRYELVQDLAANVFDLKIDGKLVGKRLGWRNRFAPHMAFGRLRFATVRGRRGEYVDLANLRVTATLGPPVVTVTTPHDGGLVDPDGEFRFHVTTFRPVATPAISVSLNGEDVTGRLTREGTPRHGEVRLGGLEPNASYRAVITAENAHGKTERVTHFYTFGDKVDGYRGIWYALGELKGKYGDKNAGGLAFCCSHTLAPMAVYAPEVDKTFFVYGGTTGPKDRYLLAMASYYDHRRHRVPRPTIVRDQRGVDDPHDNPSLTIDEAGHVWVFIAGRGRHRPGQIFRGKEPYSVESFEEIISREQTYSQIWQVPGKGFFHLLTLYTGGRELYWETSRDGRDWTQMPAKTLKKLAGFEGHYEVSRCQGSKIGTAFNYHPGGAPNRRTNLYYAQTTDFGETWTTVDGRRLSTPLDNRDNPALVIDHEAQGRLFYPNTLLFDEDSRPVILGVSSGGYAPGPRNDPRVWEITRWTGRRWMTSTVTRSDHNYDMGSLYLNGDSWTVIGPTLPGPQRYHTGGEVGLWRSTDRGATWTLERRVTRNSPMNHSYVRRPHNPADPFWAMWADGDSSRFSPSRLYFTNSTGDRLYMLPYDMDGDFAEPVLVDPPTPPPANEADRFAR